MLPYSGFAVVLAEAPSEAAQEEAAVAPGASGISLDQRKVQRLIGSHIADWYKLCPSNLA